MLWLFAAAAFAGQTRVRVAATDLQVACFEDGFAEEVAASPSGAGGPVPTFTFAIHPGRVCRLRTDTSVFWIPQQGAHVCTDRCVPEGSARGDVRIRGLTDVKLTWNDQVWPGEVDGDDRVFRDLPLAAFVVVEASTDTPLAAIPVVWGTWRCAGDVCERKR